MNYRTTHGFKPPFRVFAQVEPDPASDTKALLTIQLGCQVRRAGEGRCTAADPAPPASPLSNTAALLNKPPPPDPPTPPNPPIPAQPMSAPARPADPAPGGGAEAAGCLLVGAA
jgi:hypothetical protein